MKKFQEEWFDSLNQAFSVEMFNAVKKVQRQQMQKEALYSNNDMNKELKNIISLKANQEDVDVLYEQKSNKSET